MVPDIIKRWNIAPPITPAADLSLQDFSPIMRQLLFNRGYSTFDDAISYLFANTPEGSQPQNMLGVPEAAGRIRHHAIKNNEPIVVYGDYDADGVTATALLTDVVRSLGGQARGYIPNRFEEGYGLNIEALNSLKAEGVRLVITVDCGVRSLKEAEHAKNIGLDLIITDHHHPGEQLPQVTALVNPKQPGETYPDRNLAGVGLVYKLACALLDPDYAEHQDDPHLSPAHEYLDLVALGTVADQVPLIGENRHLVRSGLEYLRRPHRQGVLSLIGAAQLNPASINAESIGFALGPRLNAAGRLDSAQAALDLLLTRDVAEAGKLAQLLNSQNQERQEITRAIQAHAETTALIAEPDAPLLFAVNEDYNPGVIGLAAARLLEKYYRPAIVAHQGAEFTRGSCRSIPEFHITRALDQCADLLIRHGGHAAAAGFTVRNSDLPELIDRLNEIANAELGGFDLRPMFQADMELELSELDPRLTGELANLEPTGSDNPPALFVSRSVRVLRSRPVGKDSSHLKLAVTDGRITYDAIAFRLGHLQPDLPLFIDLLFSFEINRYNGNETLQLNVKDIHPTGVDDQ
ncbi:MAG: single-stranded-DNA-specific exonuclease RecJ [Anaerolineae bacterium UTCFX2]|jgi:single-stranded-DNA-specific exonuclease|nr:single-stranded-DNA-specific exonuclease RecJ [Anaerolineales bacterium]OQY92706.1 MAG: single-stranded-DNA-specific exonuclease RecJ [Anaerolineae bacterium UTCFX2]